MTKLRDFLAQNASNSKVDKTQVTFYPGTNNFIHREGDTGPTGPVGQCGTCNKTSLNCTGTCKVGYSRVPMKDSRENQEKGPETKMVPAIILTISYNYTAQCDMENTFATYKPNLDDTSKYQYRVRNPCISQRKVLKPEYENIVKEMNITAEKQYDKCMAAIEQLAREMKVSIDTSETYITRSADLQANPDWYENVNTYHDGQIRIIAVENSEVWQYLKQIGKL